MGYAKNYVKERISEEINGLSEVEVEKITKMIHLVKMEFLVKGKKNPADGFLKARGAWKQVKIEKIYESLDKEWKNWNPPIFA